MSSEQGRLTLKQQQHIQCCSMELTRTNCYLMRMVQMLSTLKLGALQSLQNPINVHSFIRELYAAVSKPGSFKHGWSNL